MTAGQTGTRPMPRSVGRRRARWTPYAVLAAVLGAACYVSAVDPNHPGHYPTCPFLALTGYYCPGCGSLRMIHAIGHGHLAEAFGRNPLAFATLPFLAYLWVRWVWAARKGRPVRSRILQPAVIVGFTAVILLFWVVRNLPIGRALAP
ncbi:DUF2752 domain-containing protein [Actinoallomurus rhizosphaericola]|uniref:DUF2752 domain-containing protein n=1 Tax=Actinoallomurus rhizosphaericola TaxID=2952536 RepID=UPI0020938223|nr:DUF2752 domain-containing protein [Actinoallomurus rhizosphaericola]MCO5999643.1 DUF2752 domain-containing protein [Actinoallomurus rhizosphaericola]